MKNILYILFVLAPFMGNAQVQNATFTITPATFNADEEITITVSNIDPSIWGETDIYLWAWYFDENDEPAGDSPTNGEWTNSNEVQKFTDNGNDTYSYTLTPSDFYNDANIGRIGMLAKAKDGSNMGNGDRKTQDHLVEVGTFQTSLITPSEENTIVNPGTSIQIEAVSSVPANFQLLANGTAQPAQNGITNYTNSYVVSEDIFFELVITEPISGEVISETFNVLLTPDPQELPVPAGMKDGINLDPNDSSTATLVLYAPFKDFVHVTGNFNENNWRLTNEFLLNKDTTTDRFWITLNDLDEGDANVLFQYVVDAEIKIADPYSTAILDEFNDVFITETTFPNRPEYPTGKTTDAVSWFVVNETPYEWQTTDFERPKQEELVIYELLIRDFDALHSYEALSDRLDYIADLNVNAIELLPVNEFDGNISWGYNPSFHMALDKYYGTKNSFKAFIDDCHSRGIAVILDVVYNHATGQNPYFRMWNDCNGCYTGTPTAENPFFNVSDPNPVFQFFNDMDHESQATQAYVDRMNAYWLEEFKIDGYRFDFTKGFTNTPGDGGAYDAARIALLKRMYDEIRTEDPSAYVILEHFAPNSEETELIEYRSTTAPDEPSMLVWTNHNYNYNEATMGYNTTSDFSSISYLNRGWETPSGVGYMESHDEERLNYKNLEFGNSNGSYNVKNLETALDRLKLAGAFYFTIPGPKMIWQFGELGYDFSINYCEDGTIDPGCRVNPKPIPFEIGYANGSNRRKVYTAWSQFIKITQLNSIFRTTDFTLDVGNDNGLKKIQLQDLSATGDEIKYVTILGNFGVVPQSIDPQFQETGTWHNMYDGSTFEVTNINAPILLEPGEYLLFANETSLLETPEPNKANFTLYPNPAKNKIYLSRNFSEVKIYNSLGTLIKSIQDYSLNSEISIESLSTGLYFLHLKNEGFTYVLKLIKQ